MGQEFGTCLSWIMLFLYMIQTEEDAAGSKMVWNVQSGFVHISDSLSGNYWKAGDT